VYVRARSAHAVLACAQGRGSPLGVPCSRAWHLCGFGANPGMSNVDAAKRCGSSCLQRRRERFESSRPEESDSCRARSSEGLPAHGPSRGCFVRKGAVSRTPPLVAPFGGRAEERRAGGVLLRFVPGSGNFGVDRLGWGFRFPTRRRFASDCCSLVILRERCRCSRRGTRCVQLISLVLGRPRACSCENAEVELERHEHGARDRIAW
jgi:hypothetical protein